MIDSDFQKMMNEHFDIYDRKTRKVLLALDESDQDSILTSLTSKLYDNIVDKIDDIDFGDIPRTKGDITALPSYDKITGCLKILEDLLVQYKEKTEPVDVISNAVENLKLHKDLFVRAHKFNVELPMVVYNTIALSVVSALSLMIATTIEFIKTPNGEGFSIALDKVALVKTRESLLFDNLRKFNAACKQGQLESSLEPLIKARVHNLVGIEVGVIAGAIAIMGILFNLLPIIRELVFFFFYTRTRVSDYFDLQADLLEMNAQNIRTTDLNTVDDKNKVVKKQLKIAEFFRELANKIAINNKSSEVRATKDIVNSSKKMKIDDVTDGSIPDSASSLF